MQSLVIQQLLELKASQLCRHPAVSFVEHKKFLSEAENTVVDTGAVEDKRELRVKVNQ